MNPHHLRSLVRLSAVWLAVAVGVAACRPAGPPPCYDCGACGIIGGPAEETRLWMSDAGLTEDGKHALRINILTKGACPGRSTELVWDASAATLSVSKSPFPRDQTVKSSNPPEEKRWWTNPEFVFSFAPVANSHTGTLTIVDAGKTTVVHCVSDEYVVSCAP